MKNEYPTYKKRKGEIEKTFESFKPKDKKIINDFLDYCSINAGESSIKKIRSKIISICDVFEKLDNITIIELRNFLMLLNKSNRKTDNQNDIKKTLKRFLKWKYDDWNKRFKEFEDIKLKKKPSSEKLSKEQLVTPEDIETLMKHSPDLRFKTLIILLFESAGRPEEILKLKWKDCDLDNKEIKLSSNKTGDIRVIPIDKSVNRLKLYKQETPNNKAEDYLFYSPENKNKPISNQTINYYLRELGKKVLDKHIYLYIFRHSRLNAIRKTLSPDVYQKFSGHSIEVGLEHYSHINNDDVREEMFEKIYDVEELKPNDLTELKKLREEMLEIKKKMDLFILTTNKQKEIEKLDPLINKKYVYS